MGGFSWYASDTKRAIRSHNPFPVYALQPDGEPLLEVDYEGYGEFGGHDIYDLVADWNRKYLAEHPDFILPFQEKRVADCDWYPLYADLTKSKEDIEREMQKRFPGLWCTLLAKHDDVWRYRLIGISIAGWDKNNFALPYPIKLVEHPVPYAAAAASKSDPCLGAGEEDRFEGEDRWLEEM